MLHVWNISYIWLNCMVNVGEDSIHHSKISKSFQGDLTVSAKSSDHLLANILAGPAVKKPHPDVLEIAGKEPQLLAMPMAQRDPAVFPKMHICKQPIALFCGS